MNADPAGGWGVLTVPNAVSLARILLVGVLWRLLLDDNPVGAAWLLILMAATDWLDGWLARRLGQVSKLGAVLDPVGDGLMMISAILGGVIKGWVPLGAGLLVLARSGLVAAWSGWVTVRTGNTIAVRMTGKAAITLLFIAVPGFYFAAYTVGAPRILLEVVAWVAMGVGLVFHWWSGAWYIRDGLLMIRRRRGGFPRA